MFVGGNSTKIEPIERYLTNLFLHADLSDSKRDCQNATKMLLRIIRKFPRAMSSVYNELKIKYKEAREFAQSFVSLGVGAYVEVPPCCNGETKRNQAARFTLLPLPPREIVEVLNYRILQSGAKTPHISSEAERQLEELEKDYKDNYGDSCLELFIKMYDFEQVVPLCSAPKFFIFEYVLSQLRRKSISRQYVDSTFVTNKSTILGYAPIQEFLAETEKNVTISNYFNYDKKSYSEIPTKVSSSVKINLFSVPEAMIRDNRYVFLDDLLISCEKRPVPYKNVYNSDPVGFYAMDISKRDTHLNKFKKMMRNWHNLGLAKPVTA